MQGFVAFFLSGLALSTESETGILWCMLLRGRTWRSKSWVQYDSAEAARQGDATDAPWNRYDPLTLIDSTSAHER